MSKLYDGPIIDAHHHFWDPIKNRHPWLDPDVLIPFRYGDYTAIKRPYYPSDYFADAKGHNVVETVYIDTEWDPTDPLGESRFITGVARDTGYPNAVVGQAWLDRSDVRDLLAEQAKFTLMRSVRHKPGGPASPAEVGGKKTLMSDETWRKGFACLHGLGLHFDLQTPWWNMPEAVLLARDFPETTIIINHTGLPADRSPEGLRGWHENMGRVAACENVHLKISGIGLKDIPWTTENNAWIIAEAVAMFGPDRVMFASNFPVDSLCGTYDQIFTGFKTVVAGYSYADQKKMFHDTAKRVYRTLPPEELKGKIEK